MAENWKKLAQGQLPTVAAVLYTVPASTQTIVKRIVLVNTGGGNTNVRLWDGGSADVNHILPTTQIRSNSLLNIGDVVTMDTAATIEGEADDANRVTFTIYGVEIT